MMMMMMMLQPLTSWHRPHHYDPTSHLGITLIADSVQVLDDRACIAYQSSLKKLADVHMPAECTVKGCTRAYQVILWAVGTSLYFTLDVGAWGALFSIQPNCVFFLGKHTGSKKTASCCHQAQGLTLSSNRPNFWKKLVPSLDSASPSSSSCAFRGID